MSICDTIIRRMGGRLEVTSSLGHGTTVRILVPLEFCGPLENNNNNNNISFPNSPILPHSISNFDFASLPPSPRDPSSPRSSRNTKKKFRKRIISDELTSLFNPGQPLASPSYVDENSTFDFERAVSLAQQQHQASLSPNSSSHQPSSLKRNPSMTLNFSSSSSSSQGGGGGRKGGRTLSFLGRKGTDTDFVDELAKLSIGTTASSPKAMNHTPHQNNGDFFSIKPHPTETTLSPPPALQEGFIPTSPSKKFAERVRVLIADDNVIGRSILTKLFLGKVRVVFLLFCFLFYFITTELIQILDSLHRVSISNKQRTDRKQ